MISVIIPNFNNEKILKKFLGKNILLLNKELSQYKYEIIIADDNSTDNSIKFIKSLDTKIKITINQNEQGFGNNCNFAISKALGDFILLLNSDVLLKQNFFIDLWKKINSSKIFSVVPRITRPLENNITESITTAEIKNSGIRFDHKNKYNKDIKKNHKILWSSGACILFKKYIFIKLSGFDSIYSPFYVEDTDLSMKAWREGYENWYIGSSIVEHYHNSTIKNQFDKKYIRKIFARNKYFFMLKHFNNFYTYRSLIYHIFLLHFKEVSFIFLSLKKFRKDGMKYKFQGKHIIKNLNFKKNAS